MLRDPKAFEILRERYSEDKNVNTPVTLHPEGGNERQRLTELE